MICFFSLKQDCKKCFLYDIDRDTVTCNIGVLFCLFEACKRRAWSTRQEHNAFFGYALRLQLYYLFIRRSYTGRFATTVFLLNTAWQRGHSKQCRNNVEMMFCVKNCPCKPSLVTSPLIIWHLILLRYASTLRPPHAYLWSPKNAENYACCA